MISIRNLSKSYGTNLVLQDVSVDIADGEVVAIIGPSGCGKSTFIRCMNLLEQPEQGQIFIGDEEITRPGVNIDAVRRKLGMVFQSFNLFSHRNVLENIMLAPMHVLKMPRAQAVREAMEYLDMVGIANRAYHMPWQLSGGQKQRVAIARCLAMHPEAILFDEPTSALDPTMVDEVLAVIRKLAKSGLCCVIVTHEMNFARNVASRVLYMDEQGIYESGTPAEIFEHPRRDKTKIFVEKLKVFSGDFLLADIDLYEIFRQVAEYCYKYGISLRDAETINLICEEYLTHMMKRPATDARVTVSVRYDEKDAGVQLVFKDTFPAANHVESGDFDLVSARLIQGFTTSISYQYADGHNVLTLTLKSSQRDRVCVAP